MPNFKLWLYGGATLIVLAMGGTIAYLNARLDAQAAKNDLLEQRLDNQEAINLQLIKDQALINQLASDLNDRFAEADAARRNLSRRLDGMNLRQEARTNPSAVELLINRDTAWSNRCNEIATGDIITEEDRTNQICPELVL